MYDKYSKIPRYVIESKLCSNAKLLYGEISLLCHKEGFCYASNKYLANTIHVTERTITRLISELEYQNLITVEHSKGNVRKIYMIDKNVYHS